MPLRLTEKWYKRTCRLGLSHWLLSSPYPPGLPLSPWISRTSKMASYGYNACSPQCPTATVTIQPPPFVVTIPGPELHCPDRAFFIEQYNPCAKIYGGSRYPALTSSEYTDSGSSYALPSLSSRSYSSYGYRRY